MDTSSQKPQKMKQKTLDSFFTKSKPKEGQPSKKEDKMVAEQEEKKFDELVPSKDADEFISEEIKSETEPAFEDEMQAINAEFVPDDDEEATQKSLVRRATLQPEQQYFMPFFDEEWWDTVTRWTKPISDGNVGMDKTFKVMEKLMQQNLKMPHLDISKLKTYCNSLPGPQIKELEDKILPCISKLVYRTEEIFDKKKIPYMVQSVPDTVELTKEQAACLLANMFFGTLKKQQNKNLPWEWTLVNFFHGGQIKDVKTQKIMCLLNYFRRIADGIPDEKIIFKRLRLDEQIHGKYHLESWRQCDEELCEVEFNDGGKIEDAKGAIEVDFANKFLGGGVLRGGMVQEEIMFTVAPECLVGILFNEYMTDREAILIKGAQTYSSYVGYASGFKYKGDFKDQKPVVNKVVDREIIAIDALSYGRQTVDQFSHQAVLRELNKSYVGFYSDDYDIDSKKRKPISTGRWGCGAFGGDSRLKFLIQWASASRARRKMIFYSFGDKELNGVESILKMYKGKTVGELATDLFAFCDHCKSSANRKIDVFTSVKLKHANK